MIRAIYHSYEQLEAFSWRKSILFFFICNLFFFLNVTVQYDSQNKKNKKNKILSVDICDFDHSAEILRASVHLAVCFFDSGVQLYIHVTNLIKNFCYCSELVSKYVFRNICRMWILSVFKSNKPNLSIPPESI